LRLLIAGAGDRERRVANGILSAGLGGAVRMIGAVRGQEKLDLLAAADVMVRTSTHEVFPEAYLESLSVGTPVAATPAGDTPFLAEESGAIELLPFADPAGQAVALGALLDDPERRERMRASALEYSRRFVWARQKDRYWDLLATAARGEGR
jgi:glycosyltransferase involved in cell wall biosynthesis